MKLFRNLYLTSLVGLILFLSQFLFAQNIVYFTDIEGQYDLEKVLIEEKIIIKKIDGTYRYAPGVNEIVINGDVMDRGPYSLRIMQILTKLAENPKTSEGLTLIIGNHEAKLSFIYDLHEKMSKNIDLAYRDFLEQKYNELPMAEQKTQNIASLNNKVNQVLWWAQQYGFTRTLEYHQNELREIRKTEVTFTEAVLDYYELLTNPKREMLRYFSHVKIAYDKGGPFALVHGGMPATDGFIPDSSKLAANYNEWCREVNDWYKRNYKQIIESVQNGNFLVESAKKILFYIDALWVAAINSTWNHDNSAVYGPRYKNGKNPALIPKHTVDWLAKSGQNTLVIGHTPMANVGVGLRFEDRFLMQYTDTSYTKNGIFTRFTLNKQTGEVTMTGILSDGTRVKHTTSAKDAGNPIGLRLPTGEIIVTKTLSGQPVSFSYGDKYAINEKIVPMETLESLQKSNQLTEATISEESKNSETEFQRKNLLEIVQKNGVKIVDHANFDQEVLKDRIILNFIGSSAFADESMKKIAEQMVDLSLKVSDPSRVVVLTGGTNAGVVEPRVHDLAKKLGFYVHGLIVSAASPVDVDTKLDSVSLVGDIWEDQPKEALRLVEKNKGLSIIIGGGGLVSAALKELDKNILKSRVLFANNISHGAKGAVSASMTFGQDFKDRSFNNADALIRLMKRNHYRVVKKVVIEATPERVKQDLANRGKLIVTFIGFSGQGYEESIEQQKERFNKILDKLDPKTHIINIGGTPDGIGLLYEVAKERHFITIGIVSSKAEVSWLSPFADTVYMIKDKTWGGLVNDKGLLAATSRTIVDVTDLVIAIGGGAIGRDEFLHLVKKGVPAEFYAAIVNKAKAIKKAVTSGSPVPTEFRGDLEKALINEGYSINSNQPLTWNIKSKVIPSNSVVKEIMESIQKESSKNKYGYAMSAIQLNNQYRIQVAASGQSLENGVGSDQSRKTKLIGSDFILVMYQLSTNSPELAKMLYTLKIKVEVFAPGASSVTETIVLDSSDNVKKAMARFSNLNADILQLKKKYAKLDLSSNDKIIKADKQMGILSNDELKSLNDRLAGFTDKTEFEAKEIQARIEKHEKALQAKQLLYANVLAAQEIKNSINNSNSNMSDEVKSVFEKSAEQLMVDNKKQVQVDMNQGQAKRSQVDPTLEAVKKAGKR